MSESPPLPRKWPKRLLRIGLIMIGAYLLLLIPGGSPPVPESPGERPFVWDQDARWEAYEKQFLAARAAGCESLESDLEARMAFTLTLLQEIDSLQLPPTDQRFRDLEQQFFGLAPMIGACEDGLGYYLQLYSKLRETTKSQSQQWDMNSREARETLYRLLYGGRAAAEEVMLQVSPENWDALTPGKNEPSATPMAHIHGVDIHSGDILVSRGGAAASALISRGNDFPGNFSHVALVHIDEQTQAPSIIEAHIELGVAIADLNQYLEDKKLRVLVLRPRADLPAIQADPMLPHKAATYALEEANTRHIPYDFAMDFKDPHAKFCSEVAYDAYHQKGLDLWMGISTISSEGLVNWLSAIGVTNFETHEPADLEYDPQLTVVAEWRNLETLFDDHVDNAVIDLMLEGADAGDELEYAHLTLPLVRLAKAYSWIVNQFGGVGPVPEGMNAVTALKIQRFSERHAEIKAQVLESAQNFQTKEGYLPPYWELIRQTRQMIK